MNGMSIAHLFEPADDVGGDFYDVIPLDGGDIAAIIADVMSQQGHRSTELPADAIARPGTGRRPGPCWTRPSRLGAEGGGLAPADAGLGVAL